MEKYITLEPELSSELLTAIPYPVLIADKYSNLLEVNDNFCQISGYSREEIMTYFFSCEGNDENNEYGIGDIKKILYNDSDIFDIQIRTKSGNFLYMEVNCVFLPAKEQYVFFLHDFSERKRKELLFEEYIRDLKESNAAKDKFFSILAHDLRSPFQGFLGLSEVISTDIDNLTKKEIKHLSLVLNTSLKKQFELLTDLLYWSRLKVKGYVLNSEVVFLSGEVNKILESFTLAASQKNISVKVKIDEDLIVYADSGMLQTVLRNLVSNSIKFTNQNGYIEISAVNKRKYAEITVSDNGIGIQENNLQKIFRLDIRFSTEGTENETGTGLGLMLCKEIIDKHSGSIRIESEPNKGTKIIFTLPAEEGKVLNLQGDAISAPLKVG